MFRWLFRKDKLEVYKPKERLIFSYWNGVRMIKADPVVLYKRYAEKRLELGSDIRLSRSMHKDADKGHESVMEKIRYIFLIKKPDNLIEPIDTLDESELLELMDKFLNYIEDLKKNWNPSAMQSNSSVDLPNSSQENQATSNFVVSGSTAKESFNGEQESLPTEQELQQGVLPQALNSIETSVKANQKLK